MEQLYGQLLRAEREAQKDVRETPPGVRSELLAVRPELDALLAQGGELMVNLHEAAHDSTFVVDRDRLRTWDSKVERVLFELLAALDGPRDRGRPTVSRPARIIRRTRDALAAFLETEASGGIVLVAAATAGILWANVAPGYDTFWHAKASVAGLEKDVQHWVNDGLMTVFFLVVGLEIKREFVTGELRDARVAMLPVAAALGGMAAPALVYLVVSGGGDSASGWAIPMATDIAFVVGALALLGSRVQPGLKLFLLALAIVDDIGAIAVIAVVYSHGIEWLWLGASALVLAVVVLMRLVWVRQPVAYLLVGAAAWAAILSSGIHPTIAGVAVGLLVPARPVRGRAVLEDLERWLHPISSYLVVPVFALANAGIVLTVESLRASLMSGVFWGVALGLLIGKTVGIAGASFLAESLRVGTRPTGVSRRDVGGGAMFAGIGFTVSLFIAGIAFDDRARADQARFGILAGSFASAVAGALVLGLGRPETQHVGDGEPAEGGG